MEAKRALFLLTALALLGPAAGRAGAGGTEASKPKPYFHDPAVSADGARIAFCHRGDVWLAGADGSNVRRLTDHTAFDTCPVFSPTSRTLAFSSDREGAMDVYVVPESGGTPKRLTFHSAGDRVLGFTPFGNAVVFLSRRDTRRSRIYSVPLKGGEPAVLIDAPASELAFSPRGDAVAFALGAMAWWRRGYRGSGNFDIWVKMLDGRKARRVTRWKGNDNGVMWGSDGLLYFVSDRKGIGNLWKMDPNRPDGATQVTFHERHPVVSPRLSADGRWIVYACLEGGIHLFDAETGKSDPVPLKVVTDRKENRVLRKTFTDKASEAALSKDGEEIAFVVRGALFAVGRKDARARRLTEGPFRERFPAWTPDGKTLLFVSDRRGNNDIYAVRSDEEGTPRLSKARYFETECLVAGPTREEKPVVSPDGGRFVYLEGGGNLYVRPLDPGAETPSRLLAKGPMIEDPVWSPDGRWIAFCKAEKDWNQEIYVVASAGGEAVNVTLDPDDDIQPAFGPGGEYLYFASSRGGGDRYNLYRVPLTLKVAQKYEDDEEDDDEDDDEEDEEEGEQEGDGEKKGKGKGENGDGKPVEVKIDFEEIEDRAERITSTRGNDTMPVLDGDGETVFFKSDSLGYYEIWKAAADGSSLERLTRGRRNPEEMAWCEEEKELVYRTGGAIRTLSADGRKRGTIPYRAEMEIDLEAERMEAFREGWRALKDFFYDPGMHGADWEGCFEAYAPFCAGAAVTEAFNDVFRMMLGELNASHLGIYGPGSGRSPEKTGFTGLFLEPGPKGKRYEVVRVLEDSPADREESKVEAGAFLATVNREPVAAGDNLARLFNGTVGEKVDLGLSETEAGPVSRTVTLKPVDPGRVGSLLYEAWVKGNREKVEERSRGRLGYIHIRWMSGGSFRKFRRAYLSKVRAKDGLVLDVRGNPGGYIHNELWELLSKRKPVGRFRIRGASPEHQPDHTWLKPVVLLINERSASDAEIFPWGFQRLGIGKVVGVPTWGGVIGTGGTSLINGAWLRLPYVGWYTDTGENLENLGVEPDVYVENHPEDAARGIDAQLQKAVDLVLEQLKDD